jgi:hypothetical protein
LSLAPHPHRRPKNFRWGYEGKLRAEISFGNPDLPSHQLLFLPAVVIVSGSPPLPIGTIKRLLAFSLRSQIITHPALRQSQLVTKTTWRCLQCSALPESLRQTMVTGHYERP